MVRLEEPQRDYDITGPIPTDKENIAKSQVAWDKEQIKIQSRITDAQIREMQKRLIDIQLTADKQKELVKPNIAFGLVMKFPRPITVAQARNVDLAVWEESIAGRQWLVTNKFRKDTEPRGI